MSFGCRQSSSRFCASAAVALGIWCVVAAAAAAEPAGKPQPEDYPDRAAEPGDERAGAPPVKPPGDQPEAAGTAEPEASDDDLEDDLEGEAEEETEADTTAARAPKPLTGPPRPGPLPEITTPAAPEWERHLEVGGGVVYVSRPILGDVPATTPRYAAGVGFGVHLRWDLFSFLRLHPYFLDVAHNLTIPPGALTTVSDNTISSSTSFPETTAYTFSFGARLEPTLQLTDRLRAWLSAGVGWGRMQIPVQTAHDQGVELFVRDRSFSFVEFPLGLGAGVEVIEHWLAIDYDLTAVPLTGEAGDALESFQALDAEGQARDVGPLQAFDVSFVHSLSVALIL